MKCYSYKMDHDFGFAPNPFWGVMTLATCKGRLRSSSNLEIGDWVIATGGRALHKYIEHLIFAMKVEEIITFDQYWGNPNFQCKKPIFNGSVIQMYGDNVYHTNPQTGEVIQERCAHTVEGKNPKDTEQYGRDIRGKNVLISRNFYYFGANAPELPDEFKCMASTVRDIECYHVDEKTVKKFVDWLQSNYKVGIHGDPINWQEFPFKSYPMPKL